MKTKNLLFTLFIGAFVDCVDRWLRSRRRSR